MGRTILICAEDTPQAAYACDWALKNYYKDGDLISLVYVVLSLKPPMEVFHSVPGTAFTFTQPGEHHALKLIQEAKDALEARFLPILRQRMVPYELQMYAERTDARPERVGEIILKCADEKGANLVVLSAHNKAMASQGYTGSVCAHIMSNCKRPLAVIRPPEADWQEVQAPAEEAMAE